MELSAVAIPREAELSFLVRQIAIAVLYSFNAASLFRSAMAKASPRSRWASAINSGFPYAVCLLEQEIGARVAPDSALASGLPAILGELETMLGRRG